MKTFTLQKEVAIALYGNQSKLARALGVTRAAVSKWEDNKPIPQAQALRIRYELKPEAFSEA